MNRTRIAAFLVAALADCTLFGKKIVPAGEVPDEMGQVPERPAEDVPVCLKDVGVSREGLNAADRNVLSIACGRDMHGSSAASSRIDVEEFIYSEVDIDPLYHGVHLILCSQDAKLEKYYHIMEKCRLSYELAPPDAFEAAVARYPGIDQIGRDILVHRYNMAANKLSQESAKWSKNADFNPRDGEIFFDVPHRILKTYLEERARYQDIYNQISAFRSHFAYQPFGASVPEDCGETLTQARAEYLSRSDPARESAWRLMTEGLGYWITENMILCHLGLKDYAGALAEAEILKSERREVSVFEQIYSAQAAEIIKDEEMERKVEANIGEAKGLVMDYKPTYCSLDCLTKPAKMFANGRPDWEAQIGALYPGLSVVRGVISSIADNGKLATIKWQGDPVSWESWACYDTNTVDHVSSGGEVVYRRACFKSFEMEMVRPPSVTLAVDEAEGLLKGQMAAVVVDENSTESSTLIFSCWDKGDGEKICSRVEEIYFQ